LRNTKAPGLPNKLMRLTVTGDMFCCMNSEHKILLSRLVELPKKKESKQFSADYTGSDRKAYYISSPDMRALVKDWLKDTAHLSARHVFDVVESLMAGVSHEEKKMAAYVLGYRRDARAVTGIGHLDHWLDDLTGWAEVDTLCQNVFTSKELLQDWDAWGPFLRKLVREPRTEKRRASLVFLVGPVRKCDDVRLHEMAFANIELLKGENDILITKAISWLLRSMVGSNRQGVIDYLESTHETLPKIAVRETRALLTRGKKTK